VSERGSASVLAVAVSTLILLLGLMVVSAAGLVSAASGSRTAAEAAALAAVSPAVSDPITAARNVAALNNATLVTCRCPRPGSPPPFVAHVRVETVVAVPFFGELVLPAEASAEFVPDGW
jgi:hypothetical protein